MAASVAERDRHFRWNFATMGIDITFFTLGMNISSAYVVLPLFVHHLSSDNIAAALVPAVRALGVWGTQLILASYVEGLAPHQTDLADRYHPGAPAVSHSGRGGAAAGRSASSLAAGALFPAHPHPDAGQRPVDDALARSGGAGHSGKLARALLWPFHRPGRAAGHWRRGAGDAHPLVPNHRLPDQLCAVLPAHVWHGGDLVCLAFAHPRAAPHPPPASSKGGAPGGWRNRPARLDAHSAPRFRLSSAADCQRHRWLSRAGNGPVCHRRQERSPPDRRAGQHPEHGSGGILHGQLFHSGHPG